MPEEQNNILAKVAKAAGVAESAVWRIFEVINKMPNEEVEKIVEAAESMPEVPEEDAIPIDEQMPAEFLTLLEATTTADDPET